MSALSDLSPDQRAVLQLLLKQGKTYGELAALLRVDPAAVRDRAAGALDALAGPAGDGVSDADVDELTDLVLGQGDPTPPHTPEAARWSEAVVTALRDGGLEPRGTLAAEAAPEPPQDLEPDLPSGPPVPARPAEPVEFEDAPARGERSSRLGGALLLLGIAAVVAVVLVIVLTGGDEDKGGATVAQTTGATATTTTSATTPTVRVESQINMTPPGSGSKALGVATIVTDGTARAVQIRTQGLQPNGKADRYALWLSGGPGGKATLLGFQKTPVGKSGRFAGTATMPDDATDYRRIELSRETQGGPTKPGDVVLRGALR